MKRDGECLNEKGKEDVEGEMQMSKTIVPKKKCFQVISQGRSVGTGV